MLMTMVLEVKHHMVCISCHEIQHYVLTVHSQMPSESIWIIFGVEDALIRCFKEKEPKLDLGIEGKLSDKTSESPKVT